MFLADEILDIAVQFEKNGEALYRRAVKKVADPSLSALLEWMADEEARHRKFFARLKREQADRGSGPFSEDPGRALAAEMIEDMIEKMIGARSFSLDDIDFSAIDQQDELVRTFMEFEKDTILFYEMLTPFIEDAEALAAIKTIVDEENSHIRHLKTMLANETARTAVSDC